MNRPIVRMCVLLLLCVSGWAQESRYEVSVQGSGFFPGKTAAPGRTSNPTASGGILLGFRYNANKWLAVEADYDHFRNSQKYFGATAPASINTNVHGVTGTAVVKLPAAFFFRAYALAGGGMIIFEPRGRSSLNDQTRGTFVYGGGADVPLFRRVALRAQYRGFVYKAPDFETNSLRVDRFTHTVVPSAGLAFTF